LKITKLIELYLTDSNNISIIV